MKNRVAANKVLVDSETIDNNLMVERDANGKVIRIVCITDLQVEPSSTIFYNGLITTEVNLNNIKVGLSVLQLVTQSLSIGYDGKLLLWQNLSLSDFCIQDDTQVKII